MINPIFSVEKALGYRVELKYFIRLPNRTEVSQLLSILHQHQTQKLIDYYFSRKS